MCKYHFSLSTFSFRLKQTFFLSRQSGFLIKDTTPYTSQNYLPRMSKSTPPWACSNGSIKYNGNNSQTGPLNHHSSWPVRPQLRHVCPALTAKPFLPSDGHSSASQNEVHGSPASESPSAFTQEQVHSSLRKLESGRLTSGSPTATAPDWFWLLVKTTVASPVWKSPLCLKALLNSTPEAGV